MAIHTKASWASAYKKRSQENRAELLQPFFYKGCQLYNCIILKITSMKNLLITCIAFLVLASCKKEQQKGLPPGTDSFSFGFAAGFCVGDCTRFYEVTGSKIFPDDMGLLIRPLKFKTMPLDNNKYLFSKPLLENFPAYLLNNPNSTIGCPDCSDQGALYIEIKQGAVTTFWNIDTNENTQPEEIRTYMSQLRNVIDSL